MCLAVQDVNEESKELMKQALEEVSFRCIHSVMIVHQLGIIRNLQILISLYKLNLWSEIFLITNDIVCMSYVGTRIRWLSVLNFKDDQRHWHTRTFSFDSIDLNRQEIDSWWLSINSLLFILGGGRNEETDGVDPPNPSDGSRANNPTEVCGSDSHVWTWTAQWDVHSRGMYHSNTISTNEKMSFMKK